MTELASHQTTTAEVDQLVLCLFETISDRLEKATAAFLALDQEQATRLVAGDGEFHTLQAAAEELRSDDDELDDLHVRLTSELAGGSMPLAVAIEMGLIARFYERLGDHAVNVARRISAPFEQRAS